MKKGIWSHIRLGIAAGLVAAVGYYFNPTNKDIQRLKEMERQLEFNEVEMTVDKY